MNKLFKKKGFIAFGLIISTLMSIFQFNSFAEEGITVTVGVYDYTAVSNRSPKASDDGIILEDYSVSISRDESALDAVTKALLENNILFEVVDGYYGTYISSINTLEEMDCTPESGWTFCVDDVFGSDAMANTYLDGGEMIGVHYTVNGYGADVGNLFEGGPTLTQIKIDNVTVDICAHTEGADEWGFGGVTSYYLGEYTEGGNNVRIEGDGSENDPYIIPVDLSGVDNIQSLSAIVKTTLHPNYLKFIENSNLVDITEENDYRDEVEFCVSTLSGEYRTYYKIPKQENVGGDSGYDNVFVEDYVDYYLADREKAISKITKRYEELLLTNISEDSKKKLKTIYDNGILDIKSSYNYESINVSLDIVLNKMEEIADDESKQDVLIDEMLYDTANVIKTNVVNPKPASVGGEWIILGLSMAQMPDEDEYYLKYLEELRQLLTQKFGVLSKTKNTEYARTVLALTAIGKSAENVFGYNLLSALSDYENTIKQGLNGSIFALIAIDSKNYKTDSEEYQKVLNIRQKYIDHILGYQLTNGGFSLSFGTDNSEIITADADITAMAIIALSKYMGDEKVERSINEALKYLKDTQTDNGGYLSSGEENCESVAWVICALSELGILIDDERFVKNGNNLLDNLSLFYREKEGFVHSLKDNKTNQMSTEQALCALVALKRAKEGKNGLFSFKDVESKDEYWENVLFGLENKNENIKKVNVIHPFKSFSDIQDTNYKNQIKAISQRGIVQGKTEELYYPYDNITRAEFSAVVVRALGLPQISENKFKDVFEDDWYFNYVNTASHFGIIEGVSENEFNPLGQITRQEAITMISRALKLCGVNTSISEDEKDEILKTYSDLETVSDWAKEFVATCIKYEIISDELTHINANEKIKRDEVAQMIYEMMSVSKLL